MKKAPEWIAEEIEETRGCPNELCLDALRGLVPPRALVDEKLLEVINQKKKQSMRATYSTADKAVYVRALKTPKIKNI